MVSSLTHPKLYAGYNFDGINFDEFNGAGVNWAVSPILYDALIPLTPIIVTEEMEAWFDGCPDWIAACEDNLIQLPALVNCAEVRNHWNPQLMTDEHPFVTIQATVQSVQIRGIDNVFEMRE